jgi:hypothetical protein
MGGDVGNPSGPSNPNTPSNPTTPTTPTVPSMPGDTSPAALAATYFPSTPEMMSPARVRRLTRTQLQLTVDSLFPSLAMPQLAEVMPRDPTELNYDYSDNLSFSRANFTPYTGWATLVAARVKQAAGVIDCPDAGASMACQTRAKALVARAFRGTTSPATSDAFARLLADGVPSVGAATATADMVDVLLGSPHFTFNAELPGPAGKLSDAQYLQNLTYTLADVPPESVALSSVNPAQHVASVEQTVDALLASPKAREKLARFFTAWLEVKTPAEINLASSVYPEFTPEVANAAVEEVNAFLKLHLSGARPQLRTLTQATQSIVTPALAPIYGPSQATSRNGQPVSLDSTQRLGLFTLPAVLASHSGPTTTRLVKRGVFFTRKVMCLPLGNPPPGTDTTAPTHLGNTERDRVEVATQPGMCMGCHTYINPFGFMQESYEATGKWRTLDEGHVINSAVSMDFLDEGRLDARTPVEALKGITESMRFKQCFVRQMFRYYMGRDERPGDNRVLHQMLTTFVQNDSQDILGALKVLALSHELSHREVSP